MSTNHRQLFDLVRAHPGPSRETTSTQSLQPPDSTAPAILAVHWPDGSPCLVVEMYLLYIADTVTVRAIDGGTLRAVASALSPLIRFCWERNLEFWELDDSSFHNFVCDLSDQGGAQGRNRNTERRIIDYCTAFLAWLQEHISTDRLIVGLRDQGPQIILVAGGKASRQLRYPFRPEPDPVDRKRPMPRHVRNRLWDTVGAYHDRDARRHPEWQSRFCLARRQLALTLFEATGCRPSELSLLRVSENADCVMEKALVMQTMKRRRPDCKRSVPVDFGTAIRIQNFIDDERSVLLKELKSSGLNPLPNDRLFLSATSGNPLDAPSLEREFHRLAVSTDLDQRACISMFRHRFITNMVKMHIQEFMSKRPDRSSSHPSDADYRLILDRVRSFTGHASVESLFHYIDWAWEEMTSFDHADAAIKLMQLLEATYGSLSSLIQSTRYAQLRGNKAQAVVDSTRAELLRLRREYVDLLNVVSTVH
ncbi:site-specific recombinase XerD [Paraburkholderia sp. GAS206C]